MSATRNVAVLVGSLRKESFSRKFANALIAMAPATLKLEIVEIRDLPLYNQDDDANPPAASAAFKQRIQIAEAVLFVTPEYNRSVPGVLKNAIDVASRPYGQSAWAGKPGGVISDSPGAMGGIRRQSRAAPVAGVPQRAGDAAARGVHRRRRRACSTSKGALTNDSTREFLAEIPGGVRAMDRAQRGKIALSASRPLIQRTNWRRAFQRANCELRRVLPR